MKYAIVALLLITKTTFAIQCGDTVYSPGDGEFDAQEYNFVKCISCDPGDRRRELIGDRILTTPTGANTCTATQLGYYIGTDEKIKKCPTGCTMCMDSSTCSSCESGYLFDTDVSSCLQPKTGCLDYAATTSDTAGLAAVNCLWCAEGFYLDAEGACQACIDNCGACTGATAADCTGPGPGYHLASGVLTACTIENCMDCSGDVSDCEACVGTHFLYLTDPKMCLPIAEITEAINKLIEEAFKPIASLMVVFSLSALTYIF